MIVKPAIGFLTSSSDAKLLTDAQAIVTAMTDNSVYPTPSPTLPAVTTAINEFAQAIADAVNGGRDLIAIKNANREALGALLRELASYVAVACKSDMVKLLGSGFPIQKPTRTPAGVLPAPATPVLSLGARMGELAAMTSPVANAYTYNWRVSSLANPAAAVRTAQTTAARTIFDGLVPGQIYAVAVNVVGSAGPSDWSDAVQLMVV